jgi:hypothetical protein
VRGSVLGIDRLTRELVGWVEKTRAAVPARHRRLAGTPAVHPAVDAVTAELRDFGVETDLRYVWSIDGSGVEDDEPRVVHLHRGVLAGARAPARVRALAERVVGIDLVNVIRHEVGHALLFLDPRAAATAEFRQLFGDVDRRYRVGSPVDEIRRRIDGRAGLANPRYRKVVSLYAAAHPHEAFAEAVRVALATGGDADRIRAWAGEHDVDEVVRFQIGYAADWLATYRAR